MTKTIKAVFIRTPYNYDMDAVSQETGLLCADKTLAKQSFKDECDINVIVDRFGVGYSVPEGGIPAEAFGSFESSEDFHSMANRIAAAHESFDMLSAQVRTRFGNDPANLITFLDDERNREEAVKLGLVLSKPAEPASIPADTPVPSSST